MRRTTERSNVMRKDREYREQEGSQRGDAGPACTRERSGIFPTQQMERDVTLRQRGDGMSCRGEGNRAEAWRSCVGVQRVIAGCMSVEADRVLVDV